MSKENSLPQEIARLADTSRESCAVARAFDRARRVRSSSLAARDRRRTADSFGRALLNWVAECGVDPAGILPDGLDAARLRSGRLGPVEIGAEMLAALCRRAEFDRVEFLAFVTQEVERRFKAAVEEREIRDHEQLAARVEKEFSMLQNLQELLQPLTSAAPATARRSQAASELGTAAGSTLWARNAIDLVELLRWARGRVPPGIDVEDVVQEVLVAARSRPGPEPQHRQALLAYARRLFMEKIRAELSGTSERRRDTSTTGTRSNEDRDAARFLMESALPRLVKEEEDTDDTSDR